MITSNRKFNVYLESVKWDFFNLRKIILQSNNLFLGAFYFYLVWIILLFYDYISANDVPRKRYLLRRISQITLITAFIGAVGAYFYRDIYDYLIYTKPPSESVSEQDINYKINDEVSTECCPCVDSYV